MLPNFDDILVELGYRISEGIVDLTKPSHITELVKILREYGISDAEELAESASLTFVQLVEDTMVKNKNTGNVYTVKNFNPDNHLKVDPNSPEAKQAKQPTQSVEPPPKETNQSDGEKRIIAGKDKSVANVDTLKSEEFEKPITPTDEEFNQRNTKIANPIPPEPYQFPKNLAEGGKFPKRYVTILERMMNTKPTGDGTKWFHYSDAPGGAGQISAQAGELMTMMGTTMSDEQFKEFTTSLLKHEHELIANNKGLKDESKRIITTSWIQAATNNRSAILKRLRKEYPGGRLVAGAWDTKGEVEALGMKNYEKNKGFSTDAYFKIKTKDGKDVIDEVSLKKSTKVYLTNSGAGSFMEWDPNIPDDINQNVYRRRERTNLAAIGEKLSFDVQQLLRSDSKASQALKDIINSKHIGFDKAVDALKRNKGSRAISKVVLSAVAALKAEGNETADAYLKNVKKLHKEFQVRAIKAITENPNLKEGMLKAIRSEFPLKAVSEGEESMAIGPHSLDRAVMKVIFGTSDYNDIKDKLIAEPGPPPYLGYQAHVGDVVIPLAQINLREDGVGYGGQIKFEMLLDERFAKALADANKKVYS